MFPIEVTFTLLVPAILAFIAGMALWALASVVRRDATRQAESSLVSVAWTIAGVTAGCGVLLSVAFLIELLFFAGNEAHLGAILITLMTAVQLLSAGVFAWKFSQTLRDEHEEPRRVETWTRLDLWLRYGVFGPAAAVVSSIKSIEHATAISVHLGWWLFLWSTLLAIIAALVMPVLAVLFVICLVGLFLVIAATQMVMAWGRRFHEKHWTLWQIYLAIRSRRPLADELDLLSEYAWGKRRRQLRDMCEEVQEGLEPEDIFVHPTLLTSLEGAQISAGLKANQLPRVLGDMVRRQAEFADRLSRSQNPVVGAIYLWSQLIMTWATISFVMYYIVPKLKKIFDDFGMELPGPTVSFIRLADTFVNYWYLMLPGVLAVAVAMTGLMLLPLFSADSRFRERLSLIWPRICLPEILRSLALAVEAQIPLEEALLPFVKRQLQIPLHNRLVRVQEAVRDGHDCWDEMVTQRLLTTREAVLLQSAQRAGNLPWALNTLSDRCEQRWQFGWLFAGEFLQPIVIIVLSLFIGYFAIALFLPLARMIYAYA